MRHETEEAVRRILMMDGGVPDEVIENVIEALRGDGRAGGGKRNRISCIARPWRHPRPE